MFMKNGAISLFLILLLCNFLFSCQQRNSAKIKTQSDSILYNHIYDSLHAVVESSITHKLAFDTAGLFNAPIKIITATPYKEDYSNFKSVHLEFKNISTKTIEGIRFRWYGVNAFGEDADMGGVQPGIGGGFTDNQLKPGKSAVGNWNVLSRDLKKLVIAYPTEVAFSDGTKWKLN